MKSSSFLRGVGNNIRESVETEFLTKTRFLKFEQSKFSYTRAFLYNNLTYWMILTFKK